MSRKGSKGKSGRAGSGEAKGPVSAFWGLFKTLGIAVLIAMVVRTFLFEPFSIPSASMYPGLLVGDYLFVSKYSYGYSKYSYPFSPNVYEGRVLDSPPNRGDVAVFRQPSNTSKDFIKRVVGLPGDQIEYRSGRLHINGKIVRRKLLKKAWGFVEYDYLNDGSVNRRFGRPVTVLVYGVLYREWLPGESDSDGHLILLCNRKKLVPYEVLQAEDEKSGALKRWTDTELAELAKRDWQASCGQAMFRNQRFPVVKPGHYFMMGDNRDNSSDSRLDLGQVPAENLIGRAEFRFFSSDGTARIWEVWKWPSAIRFNRLFTGIE